MHVESKLARKVGGKVVSSMSTAAQKPNPPSF